MSFKLTHKKINQILALAVVIIGTYLVFLPLVPKVNYQLKASTDLSKQSVSKENRLVIQSAKIDTKIVEGADISVINNGNVWHRPQTSSDPNGGNMVVVGHNFTYKDPTPPFYSLGNVSTGDTIKLFWAGKQYTYQIISKRIIEPTAVEVEKPTDKPTLTLYTCYPLFVANKRLVIQAERQ